MVQTWTGEEDFAGLNGGMLSRNRGKPTSYFNLQGGGEDHASSIRTAKVVSAVTKKKEACLAQEKNGPVMVIKGESLDKSGGGMAILARKRRKKGPADVPA